MRWSVEELIQALAIYKEYTISRKIIHFPKNTLRRIKVFFKWVFVGYTDLSLWSLDTYFSDIIIYRLKKFRNMKKMGYPSAINEEKWEKLLLEIIDKWEKMRDDYYINQFEYPEPIFHEIEIKGKKVTAFNTNLTPEQKKERDELNKKQIKNNEEVFKLFSENFHDFWD